MSGFRFATSNPFDKINIAKASARILKGFTSEMYWDYCALLWAMA